MKAPLNLRSPSSTANRRAPPRGGGRRYTDPAPEETVEAALGVVVWIVLSVVFAAVLGVAAMVWGFAT